MLDNRRTNKQSERRVSGTVEVGAEGGGWTKAGRSWFFGLGVGWLVVE